MEIPDFPRSPLEMDSETRDLLKSKLNKLDKIEAIRIDGDNIFVKGNRGGRLGITYGRGYDYTLNRNTEEISEDSFYFNLFAYLLEAVTPYGWLYRKSMFRRNNRFQSEVIEYVEGNKRDAEVKMKDIRMFQGTIEEVAKDLGRPLQRVDTGQIETFIEETDTLMLRARAYLQGANLIVHYLPGSSIGTPVKYVDKE